jgi:hypothetical protein
LPPQWKDHCILSFLGVDRFLDSFSEPGPYSGLRLFTVLFTAVFWEPDLAFVFFAGAPERNAAQGTSGRQAPFVGDAACAFLTASLAMASTIQRK